VAGNFKFQILTGINSAPAHLFPSILNLISRVQPS